MRAGQRRQPVRLIVRRLGRLRVTAHGGRQDQHIGRACHGILGGRDHEVEQRGVGARVAEAHDLRPAAAHRLDPARDRDAAPADADHQVRPRRAKRSARVFRQEVRLGREQPQPQRPGLAIGKGSRLERDSQPLRQGQKLVVVSAPLAQQHPDARPCRRHARTRRYSRTSCSISTATIAAVPITKAIAAPITPNRQASGAITREKQDRSDQPGLERSVGPVERIEHRRQREADDAEQRRNDQHHDDRIGAEQTHARTAG